jgi:LuxR family maltose regulon positive regulatory protein
MADPAGARTIIREAEAVFRHRPDLGILRAHLDELKSMVQDAPAAAPGMSTLTTAELRLLPLLATHLSFPEIGERLYVSRHTVKSQAISIYRKLGVSSRSEAVSRAGDLGLLES